MPQDHAELPRVDVWYPGIHLRVQSTVGMNTVSQMLPRHCVWYMNVNVVRMF